MVRGTGLETTVPQATTQAPKTTVATSETPKDATVATTEAAKATEPTTETPKTTASTQPDLILTGAPGKKVSIKYRSVNFFLNFLNLMNFHDFNSYSNRNEDRVHNSF